MDRIRELIEEIRVYGVENNVPIMSVETIDTIKKIINENNIHSILEIDLSESHLILYQKLSNLLQIEMYHIA